MILIELHEQMVVLLIKLINADQATQILLSLFQIQLVFFRFKLLVAGLDIKLLISRPHLGNPIIKGLTVLEIEALQKIPLIERQMLCRMVRETFYITFNRTLGIKRQHSPVGSDNPFPT